MASYFEVYKKWLQNRTLSMGPIELAVEFGLGVVPYLLPGQSYDFATLGEASTVIVALWKALNDSILEPGNPLQRWLTVLEVVSHDHFSSTACADATTDAISQKPGWPEFMLIWYLYILVSGNIQVRLQS